MTEGGGGSDGAFELRDVTVWGATEAWAAGDLNNTAIGATRDLSRTLVYSVNATDAKGGDMNPTALKLLVATFGAPSGGQAPPA
ncbi:hypothetical protein [Streptomyces sp. NPDC060131]|uniref:hypothetical protein n=1 Tax=unclassified Streptomyces TaxID=2593676 RepID=UPI003665E04D